MAILAYLYGQWPTVAPRSARTPMSSPKGSASTRAPVVNTPWPISVRSSRKPMSARNWMGVLPVLAHDPLELDRLPPACV